MARNISENTFNVKYYTYSNMIFKIAINYTHNRMDAEDVVQNTFIKYCQYNKPFLTLDDEKYWLIRVAINESINFIKQASKTHEVLTDDLSYVSSNDEPVNDNLNKLEDLVNQLPLNYRTIIILHYYQNLKIEEIAVTLKLSSSNVKKRLERARNLLKKGME